MKNEFLGSFFFIYLFYTEKRRHTLTCTRTPVPHKRVRRTISAGTAALLADIMEQVVERGTGTRARVPGFTVAGKTGTAQKVVAGRYSSSDYNASFVGFVPSRQPEFTIVVVIDSPHGKNSYYGGSVAAPIFQRIAEAGLRYRGVPRSIDPLPPLLVQREDGRERPTPTSGPTTFPVRPTDAAPGPPQVVPDFRGLGAREAMRAVAQLGMTARLRGAGIVIEQQPEPGSPIEPGTMATLILERRVSANVDQHPSAETAQ